MPGVKHIIAVASGKGGVGKSTTAVNLALGLAANGVSTGLLDADIYGPSMPRMLDVKEKPESVDGKALKPIERYGLKTMSIGYIVNEDTPMIWRGPMVSSALEQMLRDVQWGELDVLVVDMPPGTGDAQLTLAQRVALAGAVIVSTPQDIALVDARKGLNMFRKVAVPVLGFVENMSFYLCPHCGERAEIFGHGGAREEAEKLGVPFLGEVPLHLDIRTTSDSGHPIVVSQPDSPYAQIYKNIAGRVWKQLSANQRGPRAAPRIVVRGQDDRADEVFEDSLFASLYDHFNGWDICDDFYLGLARTLKSGARVLDLGCGTGLLACRIAEEGFAVTGVDPAEGMLSVAQSAAGRRAGLLDQERGPDRAAAAALRSHLHDRPRLPGPADRRRRHRGPANRPRPPGRRRPARLRDPQSCAKGVVVLDARQATKRRHGGPWSRSRSSSTPKPIRTPASWTSPLTIALPTPARRSSAAAASASSISITSSGCWRRQAWRRWRGTATGIARH